MHQYGKLTDTYGIFFNPDREIWDSSEGDWGVRLGDFCAVFLSTFYTLKAMSHSQGEAIKHERGQYMFML